MLTPSQLLCCVAIREVVFFADLVDVILQRRPVYRTTVCGPQLVAHEQMARRPRLQIPGAVYHVMSRGNRKGRIFEDDTDRERLLSTIEGASHRYAIRCYAACLMNNHYHLVFDTPRGNLSDAMQYVNGVFSQASNRRYDRSGHLFEARFRSIIVEHGSYLRRVVRYVVLNPVRAHLVSNADRWRWSTYRATAGLDDTPDWLYLDWMALAFNASTREEAQQRYVRYVNSPMPKKLRPLTSPALGTKAFEKAVREAVAAAHADRLLPRSHTTLGRPSLDALFPAPLMGEKRDRAIQLAHVEHGYHLSEISRHLGRHRSLASQALRRLAAKDRAQS